MLAWILLRKFSPRSAGAEVRDNPLDARQVSGLIGESGITQLRVRQQDQGLVPRCRGAFSKLKCGIYTTLSRK